VLKDKDHRKRPMHIINVLKHIELVVEKMNTFDHMNYIQNMFFDYAQILQHNDYVHFFNLKREIVTYDVFQRNMSVWPLPERANEN